MKLSFKLLVIAVAVAGLGMGASFAIGVAYGRGDPKTVSAGLTQQQLASLLGVSALQGASAGTGSGTTPSASSTPGAGGGQGQGGAFSRQAGAGAGALQALASSPSGRITAISGNTVTIETRQGPVKLNLSASTTVSKQSGSSASDLKVGDTVVASGTRKDDGSLDASSVSQLPSELQALLAP
jgi:hypothetical protein